MENVTNLKMMMVRDNAPAVRRAARWVAQQGEDFSSQVVGPLLMHIDVPERSSQKLVEECLTAKYGFAFLATHPKRARQADDQGLAGEVERQRLLPRRGRALHAHEAPGVVVDEAFGVSSWLDEAVSIPPEHRDVMLSALKDLVSVDSVPARHRQGRRPDRVPAGVSRGEGHAERRRRHPAEGVPCHTLALWRQAPQRVDVGAQGREGPLLELDRRA